MSTKIDLPQEKKDDILEHVSGCYISAIRGVSEKEACAVLYVSAAHEKPFDDVVEVEFACIDDLISQILDTFLAHAIKAREYAITRVSPVERRMRREGIYAARWLDRLGVYPYDSSKIRFGSDEYEDVLADKITVGEIDARKIMPASLKEAARALEATLDRLQVLCFSAPKLGSLKGAYLRDKNKIVVWPFTQMITADPSWDITNPSINAYAAIVGHSFLHELAHLLEPCDGVVMSVLVKKLKDEGLTTKWDTYDIAVFMGEYFNSLSSYYGHCQSFRFALLYLAYKQKFIRKSIFEQIEARMLENAPFWYDAGERALKKDGTPKVAGKYKKPVWVREPSWGLRDEPDLSDSAKVAEATYGWEDLIREEITRKQDGRYPIFIPKTEIRSVKDLTKVMVELDPTEQRVRQNFMRGSVQEMRKAQASSAVQEGLLISPDGFTNLYLSDIEDPFELALRMVKSPRVKPMGSCRVNLRVPFISLYMNPSEIRPIYCDGTGEMYTLTFEELWWVLTL
jgi:hypothetical protein